MSIKPINNPLELTPQQRQAVFQFVQGIKDSGYWDGSHPHLLVGPWPGLNKADMERVWTWVRIFEMPQAEAAVGGGEGE